MNIMELLGKESIISNNLNLEVVSAEGGSSKVKMTIDEKVLNPFGIVHGGATFSLGDTAAGAAAISLGAAYVTMDSYINFISPGTGAYLLATATPIYQGPQTVVVEVEVKNDSDVLVAKGTYTMFKVEM